MLPDRVTEAIRAVPVIQFKANIIATTSSLKGFFYRGNKHPQVARLIFLSNPEKELPSINHLPNGNDRIILPGGLNQEDGTNHTSFSRVMGRKRTAMAAWEDRRLPRDLFQLSPSDVTLHAFHRPCSDIKREPLSAGMPYAFLPVLLITGRKKIIIYLK